MSADARKLSFLVPAGVIGLWHWLDSSGQLEADPVPRWRTSRGRAELVKSGHVGIVYQSLNFTYADTATPRSLILLPDATALSARAIAKVTAREQGHRGVIARLVALGGRQPADGEDLKLWLADTLRTIGARRIRHPGNHRYVLRIGGSRGERTRTRIGFTHGRYPKPDRQLAIDPAHDPRAIGYVPDQCPEGEH